jgi:hypothetical protein
VLTRKKATEVADRFKAEIGKAGDAVRAAIGIAVLALAVAVVALLIGARRAR